MRAASSSSVVSGTLRTLRRIVLVFACCAPTSGAFGQTSTSAAVAAPTLQQRVTALGQQIHWRYAGDVVRRTEQRRRVEHVLESWNDVASPTAADRERLVAWLDAATRAMMPGVDGRLPNAPRFVGSPRMETIVSGGAPSSNDLRRHGVSKPADSTDAPAPRSEWSQHPAAAPLEWVDPFTDDPEAPTSDTNRGAEARRVFRPIVAEGPSVAIDLAKLTTRVRDYNAALHGVSRQLAIPAGNDVEMLQQVAVQLQELENENRLISLYRESLTEEQRRVLPPSPSAEIAYELARREADSRLAALPEGREADRRALERLREQLAMQ